jgi:hypothetical protein
MFLKVPYQHENLKRVQQILTPEGSFTCAIYGAFCDSALRLCATLA